VNISIHCVYPCLGEVPGQSLFTGLPLGTKATVKIPIGCFALNGLDLTNVNTPFLIYTEAPFQASFTNIRWVPGAANDPDAKTCADLT
jgi:beta-glucosidase